VRVFTSVFFGRWQQGCRRLFTLPVGFFFPPSQPRLSCGSFVSSLSPFRGLFLMVRAFLIPSRAVWSLIFFSLAASPVPQPLFFCLHFFFFLSTFHCRVIFFFFATFRVFLFHVNQVARDFFPTNGTLVSLPFFSHRLFSAFLLFPVPPPPTC